MRALGTRPVFVVVLAGLAAAVVMLACGSATDRIRGGEARFDAAEPMGTFDAAQTDAAQTDAAPDADAAPADAARDAVE
jgi:hypothetical protein